MSVSSLIQQFGSAKANDASSAESSPKTRRHFTVSGASSDTRNLQQSRASTSRLESITEDRIRLFSAGSRSDSTDGNATSSRRLFNRQISEGSNKPPVYKEPALRQLSADSCGRGKGGGSPSIFRLPGMASASSGKLWTVLRIYISGNPSATTLHLHTHRN